MRVSACLPLVGLLSSFGCSSKEPDTIPGYDTGGAATGGVAGSGAHGAGVQGGSGGLAPSGGGGNTSVRDAGDEGAGPHRFSIELDYRYDTAGFFDPGMHPERRPVLEAAAALWSRAIRDDFPPVPAGTRLRLRNPEDRDTYVWVDGIEHDIDDVIVFVGTSAAISPAYGRSSPAGTADSTDSALLSSLADRVDGDTFEPWAGSVSFFPTASWFFDATPETADDIPHDQYDFLSFAVHELGHVLGFTTEAAAYMRYISAPDGGGDGGSVTFTGPIAEMTYGAPVPFEMDDVHLRAGTESQGMKALMNRAITNGTRESPTRLDEAILRDLGYEIE